MQAQSGKHSTELLDGLASTLQPKYPGTKIKSIKVARHARQHGASGKAPISDIELALQPDRPGRVNDIPGIAAATVADSPKQEYNNTPQKRFDSAYAAPKMQPESMASVLSNMRPAAIKEEDDGEDEEDELDNEDLKNIIAALRQELSDKKEGGGPNINIVINLVLSK